jgi:polyisoprenoid-binding protein YceI
MIPCALALAAVLSLHAEPASVTAPGRYVIDAAHSTIAWELPATLHTVHGKVPELSGFVDIVEDASGGRAARGRVAVQAAAMTTGNDSRDRKMRDETLETSKYPEIVFDLHSVAVDWARIRPGETASARIQGDLSVHGKTLPIAVPVRVEISEGGVLVSGAFDLPWKAFGVKDPSFTFVTVREPMRVSFRLRAVPAPGEEKSDRPPL